MNDVLKLVNVEKSFNTLSGEVEAVGDVSFDVHDGEIIGIVGSSGCGKGSQIYSDKNTNFSNRRQIDIKHCLFPNGTDGVKFGATESVTAYYEHDGTFDEYHIETAMKHVTDNKGGYSQFNGNTPEDDLKYRITGSVTYKAHTNA